MKTRTWILLLGLLLAVLLGLSFVFLSPGENAAMAEIYSDGKLVAAVSLAVDRELEIVTELGSNTVTVKDGAIAVTAADCPDHYCMHWGFCSGGSSIVCLPHRLVIEFKGAQEVDFVVG